LDSVQVAHEANWSEAKRSDFVARVNAQILLEYIHTVRLHASGDFYSVAYLNKWIAIARKNRHVRFFVYARCWTRKDYLAALRILSRLPNVQVWLSTDRTMDRPPRIKGMRIAWMAENDTDVPLYPVDLVFRNRPRTPMKRMGPQRALVCPYEQLISQRRFRITCSRCGICYNPPRKRTHGTPTRSPCPSRPRHVAR
jgi:hypothetical protein